MTAHDFRTLYFVTLVPLLSDTFLYVLLLLFFFLFLLFEVHRKLNKNERLGWIPQTNQATKLHETWVISSRNRSGDTCTQRGNFTFLSNSVEPSTLSQILGVQLLSTFPAFCSLLCSKQPNVGLRPQPDKSSSHPLILLRVYPFEYCTSLQVYVFKVVSSLRFPTETLYIFHVPHAC